VIPQNAADQFEAAFATSVGSLKYARVNMKLGEIIEGEFFNHYIKTGRMKSITLSARYIG